MRKFLCSWETASQVEQRARCCRWLKDLGVDEQITNIDVNGQTSARTGFIPCR